MAYKIQFQPMQGLTDGRWQPIHDGENTRDAVK
jgi:arginyl-tRNA--protein-N-Asp/Glu arginylyltransferase